MVHRSDFAWDSADGRGPQFESRRDTDALDDFPDLPQAKKSTADKPPRSRRPDEPPPRDLSGADWLPRHRNKSSLRKSVSCVLAFDDWILVRKASAAEKVAMMQFVLRAVSANIARLPPADPNVHSYRVCRKRPRTGENHKQISLSLPLDDWNRVNQAARRENLATTDLLSRWLEPHLARLRTSAGESRAA